MTNIIAFMSLGGIIIIGLLSYFGTRGTTRDPRRKHSNPLQGGRRATDPP